jgi:CspA family cold shock protein
VTALDFVLALVPQVISDNMIMTRGTVKFFKAEKGWGAISSPALPADRDAFVHFSDIVGSGYRVLEAGEEVEFDLVERSQDSFDYVAENVRRL